jgi:hypothetical protein
MPKDIMLIGSKAALHWFPDFPRVPRDTDYISKNEINKTDSKYCPSFQLILDKYPLRLIAPANVLYTLKVSHAFWDIHWDKTMYDIRFFQSKGLSIDEELFKALYADCETRYGKKRAYLNKSNEEFFTDGVKRVYVHDDLHKAMAFYDEPLYERIKHDKSRALTAEDLFLKLSHEDKLKLCKEEIYVTALERFLIPENFDKPPWGAYLKACKLLITSMSKGWFPKFMVENWIDLSKNDRYDFRSKFQTQLEKGVINKL